MWQNEAGGGSYLESQLSKKQQQKLSA